jgi:hypothetical protein
MVALPEVDGAVQVTVFPVVPFSVPAVRDHVYVSASPFGSVALQVKLALAPASTDDGPVTDVITGASLGSSFRHPDATTRAAPARANTKHSGRTGLEPVVIIVLLL